ncbi:hypothetical protein [Prevotella dentasini]|uniref:hypothetical protein n=1 Tax=Prevotella dentasini TaxID=589537 RepID=UPI0011DD8DBB|nr:hypothetical protein [Prevotella dentasini]
MSLFHQPQPRRFHHEYIYVDERKERLRKLEEKARAELGQTSQPLSTREELHQAFVGSTVHLRRRERKRSQGSFLTTIGMSVVLIVVLMILFFYLI